METQLTIDFRTDDEVKSFLKKKVEMLRDYARGDGFNAIQAHLKLKAIEVLSDHEILEIGRQMFEMNIR